MAPPPPNGLLYLSVLVAVTVVLGVAGQEPTFVPPPTAVPGSGYGNYKCQCSMPQEQLCTASTSANYLVTFNFNWTEPRPIGGSGQGWSFTHLATHSACSVLWRNGTEASPGMSAMARFGIGRILEHERDLLRSLNTRRVSDMVIGAGQISTFASFDRNHPVMSSLTFMKPSPDWFVGLDSVNLCRGNQWMGNATFELKPWDAGVKDGRTFATSESPTLFNNIAPITSDSQHLSSSFLGYIGNLGSVSFRLLSTPPFEGSAAVEPCPSCTQTCQRRPSDFRCPFNEEWTASAPQCEVSCHGGSCDRPPVPGCKCVKGYVRETSSLNSPCVLDTGCRSDSNPSLSDICGVTNDYRPECRGALAEMDRYEVCTSSYKRVCTALRCDQVMCRCLEGFGRTNGSCYELRLDDAITPTLPPLNCSIAKREVVGSVDNNCDFSCETADPLACHSSPERHCVCAQGLFRHSVTGECVRFSQCNERRTTAPPTAAPTAAPPVRPETCPALPQCAHYNSMGTGQGSARCCPTCRQNISICSNFVCPVIPGCLRYGRDSDGTCCLPCIKRRRKYNDGVCSGIVCPSGQTCTNRGGQAMCMCKPSCSSRPDPITGRDGVQYTNACHLYQAACLKCADLFL